MTDLSLTPHDVLNMLKDAVRRHEDSTKVAQLFFHFRALQDGQWDDGLIEEADKILRGVEDRERNISNEIKQWVVDQGTGWWSVKECDNESNIVKKEERAIRRQVLYVLVKEGIIERHKSVNSRYRTLKKDERIMNPDGISMDTVGVKLPLGLSRKTTLFHGAAVVVAGVTGHGKTMMALNFIQENQETNDIYYLNSEMSDQELKFKKLAFKGFPYEAWKFTMVDVQGAMAESVREDCINVIDYLSAPSDKLWAIRDLINDIKKKLGKGMAFILVQRKENNPWGEGGIFSAQAASLYINLQFGSLEVMKNRFRESDDFRGLEKRNFEIKNGVMRATSGWYSGSAPPKQSHTDDNDFIPED